MDFVLSLHVWGFWIKKKKKKIRNCPLPKAYIPKKWKKSVCGWFPWLPLYADSGSWDWSILLGYFLLSWSLGFLTSLASWTLKNPESLGGGGVLAGRAHTSTPGKRKAECLLFRKPLLQSAVLSVPDKWAFTLPGITYSSWKHAK